MFFGVNDINDVTEVFTVLMLEPNLLYLFIVRYDIKCKIHQKVRGHMIFASSIYVQNYRKTKLIIKLKSMQISLIGIQHVKLQVHKSR